MLFVPQSPMDPLGTNLPVDPGYMVRMMPASRQTSSSESQIERHVVLPAAENSGMNTEMGMNPGYDYAMGNYNGMSYGPAFPNSDGKAAGPSKAMTIRNPKTGEVVGGSGKSEQSASTTDSEEGSGRESQEPTWKERISARRAFLERTDMADILLSAAVKSGGGTAAKVMQKRQGGGLWCTDRSTFTALNIDVIRRTPSKPSAAKGPPRRSSHPFGDFGCLSRPLPLSHRMRGEELSRDALLRFWHDEAAAAPPAELLNFKASMPAGQRELAREAARPEMLRTPPSTPQQRSAGPRMSPNFAPTGSPTWMPMMPVQDPFDQIGQRRAQRAVSSEALPAPSPKAYRPGVPGTPMSRTQELRRMIQSLLNKICPESVMTIGLQLGEVPITSSSELELLISLISKKALSEPHYIETYADLVFSLKAAFPQFPNEAGGKPVSFKSVLLNICQQEFETLPTSLEPATEELPVMDAEEVEFQRKQTKGKLLANMKFIGHLFLRQLLSTKVISSVIQELTLCDRADELPQEHVVECAVELILSIGYTLEAMPTGSQSLGQVCGRLKDLMSRNFDGRPAYSKRIQFAIQDLLEVRSAGWRRKTFKAAAKTKEEIRLDQHRDLTNQARGREVESGEQVLLGKRPDYIAAQMDEQR
jgi:translation initiation factor 4G|mmetsp:Transcript_43266/g.128165  ORF Transcript_43266/g.128165 Transcript_43266/m.128165 type:complete len:646 (-) Transcript_43266:101-2038(-)